MHSPGARGPLLETSVWSSTCHCAPPGCSPRSGAPGQARWRRCCKALQTRNHEHHWNINIHFCNGLNYTLIPEDKTVANFIPTLDREGILLLSTGPPDQEGAVLSGLKHLHCLKYYHPTVFGIASEPYLVPVNIRHKPRLLLIMRKLSAGLDQQPINILHPGPMGEQPGLVLLSLLV